MLLAGGHHPTQYTSYIIVGWHQRQNTFLCRMVLVPSIVHWFLGYGRCTVTFPKVMAVLYICNLVLDNRNQVPIQLLNVRDQHFKRVMTEVMAVTYGTAQLYTIELYSNHNLIHHWLYKLYVQHLMMPS